MYLSARLFLHCALHAQVRCKRLKNILFTLYYITSDRLEYVNAANKSVFRVLWYVLVRSALSVVMLECTGLAIRSCSTDDVRTNTFCSSLQRARMMYVPVRSVVHSNEHG